jgi:hypothetical protein
MMKKLLISLAVLVGLTALYFWAAFSWSYSSGERAGWVQKLSRKGWICKTWEGELAMVSMPGAAPEKFYFTITDDAVAEQVNKLMGRRASLHYEEKVGLPTSCFGETRHYVTSARVAEEVGLPGAIGPGTPAAAAAASAPAAVQASVPVPVPPGAASAPASAPR